jgi:hypothetical protein
MENIMLDTSKTGIDMKRYDLDLSQKTNVSWLVTPVLLRHKIRDVQTHTTLLYQWCAPRLKAWQCYSVLQEQGLFVTVNVN